MSMITANPSTLAELIADNPPGSTFLLDPGIYAAPIQSKPGNEYHGSPTR